MLRGLSPVRLRPSSWPRPARHVEDAGQGPSVAAQKPVWTRKPVARIVWAHTVRSPCHLRPRRPAAGSIPPFFRTFQAGRRELTAQTGQFAEDAPTVQAAPPPRFPAPYRGRFAGHASALDDGAGATIAASAGISVQTVEHVFGTKRELLKTVMDIATGDDEPIPVSERDWVRWVHATSQAGDLLESSRLHRPGRPPSGPPASSPWSTRPPPANRSRRWHASSSSNANGARGIVDMLAQRASLRADISCATAAGIM